ncbi:MAG: hypothetical protein HUN04_25680 [Desulfobacter sp.]|nr:MAG: hypothetical protein HUN04_25680 [Desulfobacter sp.]
MTPHQTELEPSELSLKMMNFMMMFVSEIAMSVTHDMKNYLAIINENVGFLEDLFQRDLQRTLAQDLDKTVTKKIKTEIGRSDQILKKLNRFANNLAPGRVVTDLEASLDLVIDLCAGIIRNHGAEIQITPPENKIFLNAPPFLLNLLLFRAVKTSLAAVEGNKTLNISFGSTDSGNRVFFMVDRLKQDGLAAPLAAPEEIELMQFLKIRPVMDIKDGFAIEWTG